MKKLYVLTLVLVLGFAMVGHVEAARQENAGQPEQAQSGNQMHYVDTCLSGDGIQNAYQDADQDCDQTDPASDQDQKQERAREQQGDACAGDCDQPKEQVQERDRVQEQLHTETQDNAAALAEMKRLVEQLRYLLTKLYGWE